MSLFVPTAAASRSIGTIKDISTVKHALKRFYRSSPTKSKACALECIQAITSYLTSSHSSKILSVRDLTHSRRAVKKLIHKIKRKIGQTHDASLCQFKIKMDEVRHYLKDKTKFLIENSKGFSSKLSDRREISRLCVQLIAKLTKLGMHEAPTKPSDIDRIRKLYTKLMSAYARITPKESTKPKSEKSSSRRTSALQLPTTFNLADFAIGENQDPCDICRKQGFTVSDKITAKTLHSTVRKIERDGKSYALKLLHKDTPYSDSSDLLALECSALPSILAPKWIIVRDISKGYFAKDNIRIYEADTMPADRSSLIIVGLIYPWVGYRDGSEEIHDMHSRLISVFERDDAAGVRDRYFTEELPELCQQMIMALENLHNRGIMHGDIKPENIFLSKDSDGSELPRYYLGDFGSAVKSENRLVVGRRGSRQYMAPEATNSEAVYDGVKADVYALGTLLMALHGHFEVLAPELPKDTPLPDFIDARNKLLKAKLIELITSSSSTSSDQFIGNLCQLCTREDPLHRPDIRLVRYLYKHRNSSRILSVFKRINSYIHKNGRAPSIEELQEKPTTSSHRVAVALKKHQSRRTAQKLC